MSPTGPGPPRMSPAGLVAPVSTSPMVHRHRLKQSPAGPDSPAQPVSLRHRHRQPAHPPAADEMPCPVCDKMVPHAQLQTHVEECLDDYADVSKLPQRVLDAAQESDVAPDFIYLAPLSIEDYVELTFNPTARDSLPACVVGHPNPNRYADILPNPLTRVRLKMGTCPLCAASVPTGALAQHATTCDGVPRIIAPDQLEQLRYVNANYMHGYRRKRPDGSNATPVDYEYVAAQGPNEHTVASFLQMIWDLQSVVVVMCTDLTEMGKSKCFKYFPEPGESIRAGGLLVKDVVLEERTTHYEVRRIKLMADGGMTHHTFLHFWFRAWPDHGVPTAIDSVGKTTLSPDGAVGMMEEVRKRRAVLDGKKAPLVVHCSAGCGRTGTLLAIDQLITAARLHDPMDIVKMIELMRKDRMCMVQDVSQYLFIWQAAKDLACAAVGPMNVLSTAPPGADEGMVAGHWQESIASPGVFSASVRVPRLSLDEFRLHMRGMGSKSEGFVPEQTTGPPTAPRPASSLAAPGAKANRHLDSRRWFKPGYDKDMVNNALDARPAGTFVIRESSRIPGMYVASIQEQADVRAESNIVHIMLLATEHANGKVHFQLGELADRSFESLEELVAHFIRNPYDEDQHTRQPMFLVSP